MDLNVAWEFCLSLYCESTLFPLSQNSLGSLWWMAFPADFLMEECLASDYQTGASLDLCYIRISLSFCSRHCRNMACSLTVHCGSVGSALSPPCRCDLLAGPAAHHLASLASSLPQCLPEMIFRSCFVPGYNKQVLHLASPFPQILG